MKTNKKTGALLCTNCGAELKIKLVTKTKGMPKKVVFRCPTARPNPSGGAPIHCTGGFILLKQQIFKRLSKETLGYYELVNQ